MFQLIHPTHVRLAHINIRTEKHGKHDVDAIDLHFVSEGSNAAVLGLLDDRLCATLYHDPDDESGQETVDGVPKVLPTKLFPRIGVVPWATEGAGMDLTVIYGLGDEVANIEFADGKASTQRFELKDNGVASVFWRYSTTHIPDGALDKLRKKQKQMVELTLVQQERLREEAAGDVIDGTVAAFEADHPDATDLFVAGAVGDPDSDEDEDSEGGATDLEERLDNALAREDAPRTEPSTRTERGRAKTKAALAAGEMS